MKFEISEVQKHFEKNIVEIKSAFIEALARREQVAEMKKYIESVVKEVLSENNFNVLFGYEDVIDIKVVKEIDHIYFIDNEQVEAYNKAFFEKVKENKKYYEFFELELGSFESRMGYYEANRGSHFEQDKKLVKLVRAYKENPSKEYDLDLLEKEFNLVSELMQYYK